MAHAQLTKSNPAAAAVLSAAPSALQLWFSESPEVRFTTLELRDAAGASIPLGAVSQIAGDALGISASITRPLAAGTYTVIWRTAAADGHATNGRYTFTVAGGAAPTAGAPSAAAATVTPIAPPSKQTGSNAVVVPHDGPFTFKTAERWVEFVALLTMIGAVAFRLVVLARAQWPAKAVDDAADRARRLALSCAVLYAIMIASRLVAQASLISQQYPSRMEAISRVLHDTRWGGGWFVSAIGLVLALLGLIVARRRSAGWIITAIGVVLASLGETLTGHVAAFRAHQALGVSMDITHILAAGIWLGGLVVLLVSGLPGLRAVSDAERDGAGERLVKSFHGSAQEGVFILLVTAAVTAWLHLGKWSDLWTTPYGVVLFRKAVITIIVLGFGLYHWRMIATRSLTTDVRRRFLWTAAGELLVAAVVVAATAILVSEPIPPGAHGSGGPTIVHYIEQR